MTKQLTVNDLKQHYQEALRACEADAGSDREARILRIDQNHYKSTNAYVVAGESAKEPTHVIKIDNGGLWSPKNEFKGLDFLAKALSAKPLVGQYRLGAITPVAYGLTRPFLVTRYQSGQSLAPAFDKAIQGLYRATDIQNAMDHCRAIATWLNTFRSIESKTGMGLSPEDYLKFCHERANEISLRLNASRQANNAIKCLQSYLENLSDANLALMKNAYPHHGDLDPKNFLVDNEGVIYAVDLEGFGFSPMSLDLTHLFIRIQMYAFRSPFARRASQEIWTAFWDEFMSQNSPSFALLSLINGLLTQLAKAKNPKARTGLKSRLKKKLWIRAALRWIEGLKGDLELDLEHARSLM